MNLKVSKQKLLQKYMAREMQRYVSVTKKSLQSL